MSTSTTPAVPGAVAPHFETAYLRLMPTMLRVARHHFRHVGCPDRRHDLVCEVLALYWLWHGRLAMKGRDPAEFATVFAMTAAKAVNSSRRLCGCEKARDALSPACQRRRGFTVSPLPAGNAMIGNDFDEALRDNMQTPVLDQVQFRIDFPRWADGLPTQKRRWSGGACFERSARPSAGRTGRPPSRGLAALASPALMSYGSIASLCMKVADAAQELAGPALKEVMERRSFGHAA